MITQLWLSVQPAVAIDAIARDAQNKRRHVAETAMTATFPGLEKAE
jgi:hypothetical protein